jgi:hypothetical protein
MSKLYTITPEKRRQYNENRKKKANMPLIEKAVRVVRILKGNLNEQYDGETALSKTRMNQALLEWIFENLPAEPLAPVAEENETQFELI